MKDHESVIVKKIEDERFEEYRRYEDDLIFKKTSLTDKIFLYLIIVGSGMMIFAVLYVMLQRIPLPIQPRTLASQALLVSFFVLPVYVFIQFVKNRK